MAWSQYTLLDDEYEQNIGSPADFLSLLVPAVSKNLIKWASAVSKKPQAHSLMTLMETDTHSDNSDFELATAIIIPCHLNARHRLIVEDEAQQMRVGHAYAFSQFREHRLEFDGEPTAESRPASLINISFFR